LEFRDVANFAFSQFAPHFFFFGFATNIFALASQHLLTHETGPDSRKSLEKGISILFLLLGFIFTNISGKM